jgi:hypothetical protein
MAAVDALTLAVGRATSQNNRGRLRYGDATMNGWLASIKQLKDTADTVRATHLGGSR